MTSYGLDEWFWALCSNRLELDLIWLLVNVSFELGPIMTRYDFLCVRWVILSNIEPTGTWPNFTFGQLFMWIRANNDQTWLSMGYTSDSEQCSNRLELDLFSLLVNLSCELGPIMTRYDFLWVRWVILSNVWTDLNLKSCELGQAMTRYDFLWVRWVILSNVRIYLN